MTNNIRLSDVIDNPGLLDSFGRITLFFSLTVSVATTTENHKYRNLKN